MIGLMCGRIRERRRSREVFRKGVVEGMEQFLCEERSVEKAQLQ